MGLCMTMQTGVERPLIHLRPAGLSHLSVDEDKLIDVEHMTHSFKEVVQVRRFAQSSSSTPDTNIVGHSQPPIGNSASYAGFYFIYLVVLQMANSDQGSDSDYKHHKAGCLWTSGGKHHRHQTERGADTI